MIQDIAPKHLDNQYRNLSPEHDDTVFFFEGNTVLGKQEGDCIKYPSYSDFVSKVQKASEMSVNETYDFIYLFAVSDENGREQRYFLALPK